MIKFRTITTVYVSFKCSTMADRYVPEIRFVAPNHESTTLSFKSPLFKGNEYTVVKYQ